VRTGEVQEIIELIPAKRLLGGRERLVLINGDTYLCRMKTQRSKKSITIQKDLDSPAAVDRFRVLASSFTVKASSSKKAAMAVLKREGIVTAKGNLTRHYSAK